MITADGRYPGFCQPLRAGITITLSGLLGRERGQRVDRFGLAPCGVCRAAFIAKRAVRSISPLLNFQRYIFCCTFRPAG